MKILIVKLGAIGDIVHALPTLAAIRRSLPDSEISWVAERRSAEVLRGNPLIDNLIEVDTRSLRARRGVDKTLADAAKQLKELRQYDFDIALDLQGLLKSAIIAKLSGAKERWGFSRVELREPASRMFYTDTAKSPATTHVIRRNLGLARTALGFRSDDDPLDFPIFTTEEHKHEADEIVSRVGSNFAVLNPAGGWVTKLWPAEKYGELADLLWNEFRLASVVTTGPKESDLAEQVLSSSRSGRTIAARASLKGFYELSRRAQIYVGGDTGPTHLAIAAGTPIVGIFGPTEWWRNGSLNPDDECVERLDIDCRVDCHRRKCSNWICMDIEPRTVFDAVRKRLAKVTSDVVSPVTR